MKNLQPIYILLGGSAILSVTTLVSLLIGSAIHAINGWVIILLPLIVGIASYLTFYFFIKSFITEKLRILYRSIRKGKFYNGQHESIRMTDDVILQAEIETKKWTDDRIAEISHLKEQEKFRKEFIGNLAHELKTPVFSIQGYILTLLEGGLEDEKVNRKFLERASKATERMTAILEDLDQLTKIEFNKVNLELTNFDIKALILDIFEELDMAAKARNIRLKFAKDYDPILVYADKNKIGQVLLNLINNSILYGNEGGETQIRFYMLENIVTIEVSDNGPGIPEEDLPRLFERFYRVEKSRNRNEGGSGLGLAIAKHFVEAHGQTINVRSTLGVGSTFTFGLDRGKAQRKLK